MLVVALVAFCFELGVFAALLSTGLGSESLRNMSSSSSEGSNESLLGGRPLRLGAAAGGPSAVVAVTLTALVV